jgi:hypothetical protein
MPFVISFKRSYLVDAVGWLEGAKKLGIPISAGLNRYDYLEGKKNNDLKSYGILPGPTLDQHTAAIGGGRGRESE